ncbi:ricin-type beta-trefoil lectin domain protein [Streptomyces sp. NPDC046887]|uniref:ricin-type beta-trefoil lectin domain protein n=1 Tax=Streptomyces sp. NPDC046887 TaxID=3155472 RepID=UPI0033EE3A3C
MSPAPSLPRRSATGRTGILLLAMTLLWTLVQIGAAAPRAAAAVPGYTPLTFNMQGANSDNQGKWTAVGALSAGNGNHLAHNVVSLQEAGPEGSLPGTWQRTLSRTIGTRTYEVREHLWRVGSQSRGMNVWLYWMNTDAGGSRVNLAMVTHRQADEILIVPPQPLQGSGNLGPRPAFGVALDEHTAYWTMHASSNGDNTSNDAPALLRAIDAESTLRGYQWAVGGDFNREPSLLTPHIPAGYRVVSSGRATQQSHRELDYMVTNYPSLPATWGGRVIPGGMSDHFPVEFGDRFAAAAENPIYGPSGPDACLTSMGRGNGGETTPCSGKQQENWTLDVNDRLITTHDGTQLCLDIDQRDTDAGTPVITYTCNSRWNQQWLIRMDGTIYNPGSKRCLDYEWDLTIQDCDGRASQQWAVPWAGQIVSGNGLCAGDPSDTSAPSNGENVPAWLCDPTGARQLWVHGKGNTLINQGYCVDAKKPYPGEKVIMYNCNDTAKEYWLPLPGGILYNTNSGLCLSAAAPELIVETCAPSHYPPHEWTIPS